MKALKVAGLRVPVEATDADAKLADTALSRIIDVMLGAVHKDDAPHVLKAATYVRAEVCNPDRVDGGDGKSISVNIDLGES